MKKQIKWIIVLSICLGLVSSLLITQYIHYKNAIVICVDAGHGGYDSGAIGADGTYEKTLTLAYAKQIGKYLEASDQNIRVIYTRDSDTVSWPSNVKKDLRYRVNFAKENEADYYLSIHFNSSDASAYGYSAYIKKGDKASRAIYAKYAKALAQAGWHYNRGLENTSHYPLYVVDQLSIPSMLVEVGFITNEDELEDLKQTNNRKMICKSIANAYLNYIKETKEKSDD